MEHNYEVKTSNRVLTVARSNGRITEDFLWLAGCFLIYISGHRARERGDQAWPSLAALTKSFIGFIILSIDWLAGTSFHSLGHQVSPPTEKRLLNVEAPSFRFLYYV